LAELEERSFNWDLGYRPSSLEEFLLALIHPLWSPSLVLQFQTNKFEIPFAPILGANHQKQTIIFGAALLYNETTASFSWLLKTFVEAMSGKHPNTIFTEHCAAIAATISIVFPNTRHHLGLWHIFQNVGKHLSCIIAKHPQFLP
jgi:zinc finger SWIM domain-containing protein 3